MDPLTITATCVGLVSATTTISKAIALLTSELGDAKGELSRIDNELEALRGLLQHIGQRTQTAADSGVLVTEALETQIQSILKNCRTVVEDIGCKITRCSTRRRGTRSVTWVLVRADVIRLRSSLESHKLALNLALNLVEGELSRAIHGDTTSIKAQNSRILGQIRNIRELMPQETVSNGQILDAIHTLMSRLDFEASPTSKTLEEHLEAMKKMTQEYPMITVSDIWVDRVVHPKPRRHDAEPIDFAVIVGIDYGIRSTAIAYGVSNFGDYLKLINIRRFPGENGDGCICDRVPSEVAYASENAELSKDVWGFQVTPEMRSCKYTKIFLDGEEPVPDHGSTSLHSVAIGTTPKDVVADYFGHLLQAIQEDMSAEFDPSSILKLPMHTCLTVPARWSDDARELLKEAAADAGFSSQSQDNPCVITGVVTEPEAALYAALRPAPKVPDRLVLPGDAVLVCDCGSSTVNVAAYYVESLKPRLQVTEICPPKRNHCGETKVFEHFYSLMISHFGEAFRGLGQSEINRIKRQFEMDAHGFDGAYPDIKIYSFIYDVQFPFLGSLEHYNPLDECIMLSGDDFRLVFDPVIEGITDLLSKQIQEIQTHGCNSPKSLILYGPLSEFPYVQEALSAWCVARGISQEKHSFFSQCIVSEGAVLWGVETLAARANFIRCRRHYGFEISEPFDPGLQSQYSTASRRTWPNYWDNGEPYLTGSITWVIDKGERVGAESQFESHLRLSLKLTDNIEPKLMPQHNLTLYSCEEDEQPEDIEDGNVTKEAEITFRIGKVDLISVESKTVDGTQLLSVPITVIMQLIDGFLEFRIMFADKEIGAASIWYLD